MEQSSSQNNMDIDSEQDPLQEDYSLLLERILSVHVIKSQVFGYLSPEDIKNTVLVSRKWKELVEVSSLWKWAIVRMHTIDLPSIGMLLQSPRFRLIEHVQLRIDNQSEEESFSHRHLSEIRNHLEVFSGFIIENHEYLELKQFDLELRKTDINQIQSQPLFQAICHLEQVTFSHRGGGRRLIQLSPALFRHLAINSDIHLQCLKFSGISLREISEEDLGSVVTRLVEVDLSNTDLHPGQVYDIFQRLSQSNNSKIRKLNLSYNSLHTISPSHLATVVCSLRSWDWVSCHIRSEQMAAIVSEIADSPNIRLKSACFNENLSEVEKDVLARAVVRLENVKFFDNKFSSDQLNELFKAIVKKERISLKSLEFSHCDLFLSSRELLAQAVCRLENVDLVVSQVSPAHSNAIFKQIIKDEALNLKNLTLEGPCNFWDCEMEEESSKKLRSYVGPRFKKYNK